MKPHEIEMLFSNFSGKEVLILGDVMVDSYMLGKVNRISPEAPIPVVQVVQKENRLGGAANVALNLRALGAVPLLCAIVGDDNMGLQFIRLLNDNNLETDGIIQHPHRQTTVKTRIISGNQHLLRVDEETVQDIEPEWEKIIFQKFSKLLESPNLSAVILQDYNKGLLTKNLISQAIQHCRKLGIPVLVDPKKKNFSSFKGATLFKPNFREFTEGTKTELGKNDLESIHPLALGFQNDMDIDLLMITLSEAGVYISDKKKYWHFPAHVRDIADVSGAGDTVISVAALCLASGISPSQLAIISNLAGGLVCEKVGVVPIDREKLMIEAISYFSNKHSIAD